MQHQHTAQRRLYRIPQAVEYLDGVITEKTIRSWIWRRQIDVVRIGRAVCIPQDALDRIIERGTMPSRDAR
jgi:excisionase family DNA binding protein